MKFSWKTSKNIIKIKFGKNYANKILNKVESLIDTKMDERMVRYAQLVRIGEHTVS